MTVSRSICLAFAWVALLAPAAAWTGELPRAKPEELGFHPEKLAYIDQFYSEKVSKGEIPGIVLLISRHGKIAHFGALGYANVETRQKMTTDSIFRLYSMSKPIAATALMMLYQEGRFQINEPVTKYLPEFANLKVLRTPDSAIDDTVAMVHPPTMQDVLIHTAGFDESTPALRDQYKQKNVYGMDVSLAEEMKKLSTIPLRYQPGTTWVYSVSNDVQARLVEVLSGLPFDEFLEKRLFQPLGMRDSGHWVPAQQAQRLVSLTMFRDGKMVAVGDDQSCGHALCEPKSYTVNRKRKGGAWGMVSTAADYWRFAQMMANRGELNGVRILGPRIVDYIARDHLRGIPYAVGIPAVHYKGLGWGLGFAVMKDAVEAGEMTSEGTFFWHGAAGTTFWIDPKQDLVVVALVQHFGVPALGEFWPQIRTLVYSALAQ